MYYMALVTVALFPFLCCTLETYTMTCAGCKIFTDCAHSSTELFRVPAAATSAHSAPF